MNKLSNTVKIVIILTTFAIVFLGLSIGSAFYSVDRTIKAINSIDKVVYNLETENKIDTAIEYYEKLDRNLKLEKRINNYQTLELAKKEFVRLTIKNAIVSDQRKVADNLTDEDIVLYILEVDKKAEKYLNSGELEEIENYGDLLLLKDKYSSLLDNTSSNNSNDSDSNNKDNSTEIEIC